MQNNYILSKTENSITSITLNRPEKHNALSPDMQQELMLALEAAEHNDQSRVILLQANGHNFCAGADLNWMQDSINLSVKENYQEALALARFFNRLFQVRKPIVAAVQGKTLGGGIGIISCADYVLAETNASFCFSEVKLGLAAATIMPYVLPAIGIRQAKRYLLTAETFASEQALAMQLVHRVVSKEKLTIEAHAVATAMTYNSSLAMRKCKELINHFTPITETTMQLTAELIAKLRTSDDAKQRINQFLAK